MPWPCLEKMAKCYVSVTFWYGHKTCTTSEEMDDLIEALNLGDEEKIKGLLLLYKEYGYY